MTAAATTLPLFWHLSSADRSERIDASVKLVSALQQFQGKHHSETRKESNSDEDAVDEEEDEGSGDKYDAEFKKCSAKLDSDNAPDVSYSIRRLIRGLASPRESSRLGFAVALTELLSRIDTVTCEQVLVLLKNASQTSGSMSGQEERDMLFARLFGLKCLVQSGLLFNQNPLRLSSTSSSSFKGFESFVLELLDLGEKKSWLRESCWWTLVSATDALYKSGVPWTEEAYGLLLDRLYVKDKSWSPEKVALTLTAQKLRPGANWQTYFSSHFKGSDILSTSNLPQLGRLLKTSIPENVSEDEAAKQSGGPWRPQLHFVWDIILDTLLSTEESSASTGNFQDFYRIVVDETLFASSSSPQRKYWGFLVFQKALHCLPAAHLPMLFTKNFMRTWINQLSKDDRYLHKIARQVTSDVQRVVEKDPKSGFTLVLQLIGTNGSFRFDRITKTKTVESILASTDGVGIKEYINYLLEQVNGEEQGDPLTSVGARRSWIIDQLAILIRKGSIPKTDESIQTVLDWLTTRAFFNVIKKSSKSSNIALHHAPEPPFSDELRSTCESKLLSCLGDLSTMSTTVENSEDKAVRVPGVAFDGELWISRVLKTIIELEGDTKHVTPLRHLDGDQARVRRRALSTVEKIKTSAQDREAARGAEILLSALIIRCISNDEGEVDWEEVEECTKQVTKLFELAGDKDKKKESKREDVGDDSDRTPIDLIVDMIIGLLEHSTNFTRAIADQSFSMLTSLVTDSTVDLILAQLERRYPSEDVPEGDLETGDGTGDSERSSSEDENDAKGDGNGSELDDDGAEGVDDEDTEALREALQEAVSGMERGSDVEESDVPLEEVDMDDERMMAIDEKLAAVFRTRAEERKRGKDAGAQREATYFKNRVLDLVDTYIKKQPSSGLILRFILPLVELVATSSTDEKQLSDKAEGILRSRLSKIKDTPPIGDVSKGTELLGSLHLRARKAPSQEIVSTISMCSLFVTKALVKMDEEAVIRIYKESIVDFITRKASSLSPSFIVDFIRRHPLIAWRIRSRIIEVLGNSVNGFRQTQAFSIIHTVMTSLPQPDSKKDEIMSFASEVSRVFLDELGKSCTAEKPLMNAAHMKQALKVTLSLCRFTKRYAADSAELEVAWTPKEWEKLASALSSSETFRVSTSLAPTCQQVAKISRADGSKSGGHSSKSARKRKQGTEGQSVTEDEPSGKKPKRKKVRKNPKSGSS